MSQNHLVAGFSEKDKNMKPKSFTSAIALVLAGSLVTGVVFADELKDPAERDEDISGTHISVVVDMTDEGLHRYTYRLDAPETNLGDVGGFRIDLTCDKELPETGANEPGYFRNSSRDGRHVPAVVTWGGGKVHGPTRVNIRNQASWGFVKVPPGDALTGMVIYSTAAPGPVQYKIEPYWSPFGYDTGDHPHDGEYPDEWPMREDFVVTGLIKGPACPDDRDGRGEG